MPSLSNHQVPGILNVWIRPVLDYASVVWILHINCQITALEKIHIQCRAAHFVCNNYSRYDSYSVTEMLGNYFKLAIITIKKESQNALC